MFASNWTEGQTVKTEMCKRLHDDYVGSKVIEYAVGGKGKWGRPKMRYLDVVREDIPEVGEREDEGRRYYVQIYLTMYMCIRIFNCFDPKRHLPYWACA